MKTSNGPLVLGSLAVCFGLTACGAQQTPPPREATSSPSVEAYVAPPPAPVVPRETPVRAESRASLGTPAEPARRNIDPVVEASGPLSAPQRDVLSAVAICAQKKVDKGQKLETKSIMVNVTVETSGAVSSADLDGATAALKACAQPEILKVRYPSTDDSAGLRVMQYPMQLSTEDP